MSCRGPTWAPVFPRSDGYRQLLYFWFVPIPLAWLLLKVARNGKTILPGTSELRDYAKGDAVAA